MNEKRIAIASDHAGLELKRQLIDSLESRGWRVDGNGPRFSPGNESSLLH